MADTGSFPIALDHGAVPGPAISTLAGRFGDVRTVAAALIAVFLLGSGAAAAGIQYESEGYGALTVVGGALIGAGVFAPLWLLFRFPARHRRMP